MALHFHWFLPTNGDGRDIVGGGHGVATGSAGVVRPASLPILRQRGRWQHPAPEPGDAAVSMTPFAPTSGRAQPAAAS